MRQALLAFARREISEEDLLFHNAVAAFNDLAADCAAAAAEPWRTEAIRSAALGIISTYMAAGAERAARSNTAAAARRVSAPRVAMSPQVRRHPPRHQPVRRGAVARVERLGRIGHGAVA
jgi:hypothetical protein